MGTERRRGASVSFSVLSSGIVAIDIGDAASVVLPLLLDGSVIMGIISGVLGEAVADIASPNSVASRYNAIDASRASSSSLVKWPR